MVKLDYGVHVQPIQIQTRSTPAYCQNVEEEVDDQPWFHDIMVYIKQGGYPSEATDNDKKTIRRLAMNFFLSGGVLYKRSFDGTLLRCVDAKEAQKIMMEVHEGMCGTHTNGHRMTRQIQRCGYFWLTMEKDC